MRSYHRCGVAGHDLAAHRNDRFDSSNMIALARTRLMEPSRATLMIRACVREVSMVDGEITIVLRRAQIRARLDAVSRAARQY